MKKIIYFTFLLNSITIFSQVGINTSSPKTSLQIAKQQNANYPDGFMLPHLTGDELVSKENFYTDAHNGLMLHVSSLPTNPSVKTKNILSTGVYIYDGIFENPDGSKGLWRKFNIESDTAPTASTNNNNAYSARGKGNLNLINLGTSILGSTMQNIPFPSASTASVNVDIASTNMINTQNDSYYLVPSDGIYHINFSFKTGQGIRAELLSGNPPGIVITNTKSNTTTQETLDSRTFGGIQLLNLALVGILNISLTQGQISHIYPLKDGDKLRFGVIQGGLSLGVLSDTSTELSIYKIN